VAAEEQPNPRPGQAPHERAIQLQGQGQRAARLTGPQEGRRALATRHFSPLASVFACPPKHQIRVSLSAPLSCHRRRAQAIRRVVCRGQPLSTQEFSRGRLPKPWALGGRPLPEGLAVGTQLTACIQQQDYWPLITNPWLHKGNSTHYQESVLRVPLCVHYCRGRRTTAPPPPPPWLCPVQTHKRPRRAC